MTDDEYVEFWEWVQVGVARKWVSEPVCATHQGLPTTEQENDEWEEGFDPCSLGMRIWI